MSLPESSLDKKADLRRFFVAFDQTVKAVPFELTVTDAHTVNHVKNVLRMKAGTVVILVNDDVNSDTPEGYFASLESVDKKQAVFRLTEKIEIPQNQGLPDVTLGVAMIKAGAWDLILQKATELGVRHIMPLETRRTVVDIEDADKKVSRWEEIVRNAAEQSESWFLPTMSAPKSISDFCKSVSAGDLKILLSERGASRQTLKDVFRADAKSITVVVGPEGGWTEEEKTYLQNHGFIAASLGQKILRAETAVIAALGAIACEYDAGASS